jgi:hypothetical protein
MWSSAEGKIADTDFDDWERCRDMFSGSTSHGSHERLTACSA